MFKPLTLTTALLLALSAPPSPSPPERLVRVYGELETATRIAVIVPGSDTRVATFEQATHRPGGAARALLTEAGALSPGVRLAVVAWLGYDSPATFSTDVLTDTAARRGGTALRTYLRSLPQVPITLVCHSYGSVVCAQGAPGARVDELAVIGSPGLGDPPGALPRLWAGRGTNDWVRFVPGVRLGPLGFGTDPMHTGHVFETGPGGHSDYFKPGTPSLRNLALITLGRTAEVSRG
ncbi:alpha/beta hydrolase [Nonomuraea sp. NPDC050310]|uniref:alpha/beta hydrolase n=1 Tax=Nonomuraea sp. NPDC050310 TaxID=3154935 RepID=UPI0033C98C4B